MLKSALAVDDDLAVADEPRLSIAESIGECRDRADIYRLLAGVFVEEPSREFLAAVCEPRAQRDFFEAGLRFDADFTDAPLDELREALACEYTTLFAASGGFPPVESVRLTGRYKQEPCHEVGQTYRRLGFRLDKGRFEVFADQLGVELLFVAELLDRCVAALGKGDQDGYRRLDKEIRRFWSLHLGRWVRGYARLVERTAEHSYYREMARFLGGFAAEEIEAMGLRIEDADQGRAVVPKAEIRVEFNPDEPVCNGCVGAAIESSQGAGGQVQRLHDLR